MASATTPSTAMKPNVPSLRVLHAVNPVVSLILRSPLHGMLSDKLLLLTFNGHLTGASYTIPVGYTPEDDGALTLFTDHAWWRNLCDGGKPVSVRLAGRQRTGRAEAIPDPAAVATVAGRLVARFGAKDAGSRIGLALDPAAPPSHADLAAALRGHVVIRLTLDP